MKLLNSWEKTQRKSFLTLPWQWFLRYDTKSTDNISKNKQSIKLKTYCTAKKAINKGMRESICRPYTG